MVTRKGASREEETMRHLLVGLTVVAMVVLGGCAGMSETQQRTLTGGAAGTAGGALIGAIAGNAGLGAAIGAGAGLAGGYLYGKHEDSKQQAYEQGVADGYSKAQQRSGSR
jgi:osmotically inducible lipoprotein OsmB